MREATEGRLGTGGHRATAFVRKIVAKKVSERVCSMQKNDTVKAKRFNVQREHS